MMGSEQILEAMRGGLLAAQGGDAGLGEALRLNQALEAQGEVVSERASAALRRRLRAVPGADEDEPTPFEELCLAEIDGVADPHELEQIEAVCCAVPGFARRRAELRLCRLEAPLDVVYDGKAALRRGMEVWWPALRQAGRVAAALLIVALVGVQTLYSPTNGLQTYEVSTIRSPAEVMNGNIPVAEVQVCITDSKPVKVLSVAASVVSSRGAAPARPEVDVTPVRMHEPLALLPYVIPALPSQEMVSMASALVPVEYTPIDWEAREMYEELAEVSAYEAEAQEPRIVNRLLDRTSFLLATLSEAYR